MSAFEQELCSAFCGELQVHAVPAGFAVSTLFTDASGDRLSFYVVETEDGYVLEDDGDFLASLSAQDIPFDQGTRGRMLDAILSDAHAYWDRDTYEIKTAAFARESLAPRAIAFLSGLIRSRDLALITREAVRSAFREDVIEAILSRIGGEITLEENAPPSSLFKDFPADILLRSRADPDITLSVYLASATDKLNEALIAWLEFAEHSKQHKVVAVIEDADFRAVSRVKYQRAQNRGVPMAIFRGDEAAAVQRMTREIGLSVH